VIITGVHLESASVTFAKFEQGSPTEEVRLMLMLAVE